MISKNFEADISNQTENRAILYTALIRNQNAAVGVDVVTAIPYVFEVKEN